MEDTDERLAVRIKTFAKAKTPKKSSARKKRRTRDVEGWIDSKRKLFVGREEEHMQVDEKEKVEFPPVYVKWSQQPKKRKKCWYCNRGGHVKAFCPDAKYFFCGKMGHMRSRCQTLLLLKLQRPKKKEEKTRPSPTLAKRTEEISWQERDGQTFMIYKDHMLARYLGPQPLKDYKGAFRHWGRPLEVIEKKLTKTKETKRLSIHPKLPHSCGICKEDFNGYEFVLHCRDKHGDHAPKDSFINCSPYRSLWLDWFSQEDFSTFYFEDDDPPEYEAPTRYKYALML